jgi:hypothetical protein
METVEENDVLHIFEVVLILPKRPRPTEVLREGNREKHHRDSKVQLIERCPKEAHTIILLQLLKKETDSKCQFMLLDALWLEGIRMNVRNRVFDILLVVVILSAAGFIGYRYFVSSRSTGSPVAVGTGAAVVATAPSVNLEREAQRPAHPQWLLVVLSGLDRHKWADNLSQKSVRISM